MDSEKIGRFLKELRKGKGLTQERLSEKLGVTSRSISRWENGVNMPDLDLVIE
ncbi:MAG: helix-turn-helix transcriptional regulator [Lachnospiraceae bacterium]|nr:helix-turn-helix transcriptional regulator [Lachnospiraceae bacterium]